MKKSVVSAALALVSAGSLGAEDVHVAVGSRIRFRSPEVARGRLEGTVVSLDASTFTLRLADQRDLTVIARSAVQKLEVRSREGKRTKGALLGLLAGTAIGAVATVAKRGSSACATNGISECNLMVGALFLGVPGAALGAMVAPGEQWETVSSAGIAVWAAPRPGHGFEARLSVRF